MAKQDIKVEVFYDGTWHVIPVYTRNPISISWGKGDPLSDPVPASLTLQADNRDGNLNPRNPMSPLYGLAGRNAPIRVTLNGTDVRLVAEIAEWNLQRTEEFVVGGKRGDSWVDIVAGGVLRRLGRGTDPRSALWRTITASNPVAYWPMEDGKDANRAASGIPGGPQMVIASGVIDFETDGALPGMAGYALVQEETTAQLTVDIPAFTNTGWFQLSAWTRGTAANPTDYEEYAPLGVELSSGRKWLFGQSTGAGVQPTFFVSLRESNGDYVLHVGSPTAPAPGPLDGSWHLMQLWVEQVNATEQDVQLWVDGSFVDSDTFTENSLPTRLLIPDWIGSIEVVDVGIAHIAVHNSQSLVSQWYAGLGWPNESAVARVQGLASERGLPVEVVGDPAGSQTMGPQYPDTTMNLLGETERTEAGILSDRRDALGLRIRTGRDLYRQDPVLELNFADIMAPLDPVFDDRATRNDVTVNRREGASARAVQETGPMNVQDPSDDPDGVGRTVATIDLNPSTDEILPHHATWQLHLGVVDEITFAQVTVNADKVPGVSAVTEGDLITIAGLPADLTPDLARLIVIGGKERIESHRRTVTFNCMPASPYDVGEWDEAVTPTSTRWGPSVSTTAGTITTGTSTSLSVTGAEVWTTSAGDFPLDINLLGARVRVTNITGSSPNWTFTISTSVVNGVRKSIPSGTPVRLWQPALWGL
ncbi:hypothetical protein [Asanoa siamensis]|uniref:Minor tail protein n=1 Tax=Asanoa siamensis TaxID=926357 RepID=A0ABQ4CKU5_9ACTN|nr:hypothetical protein [Asanoa siamensis]GIF71913.1 hypothetical protein Asi02nite_14310 [Asanoa siamensis]